MSTLAAINPWAFKPHPEVWFLIAAMVGLGGYAVKVIGPKVVSAGEPVVTRTQKRAFIAAVALLWLAADWPMHDISEKYLYSLHMIQHLIITFVVPPLLLVAMPEWLARLLVFEGGWTSRLLRRLTHPVVAGLIFNAMAALIHWTAIVNFSSENGPFHYMVHLTIFFASMLMWTPVIGPLEELRLSPIGKTIYLFIMSLIPTIPAAWLTFATGVVYSAYDTPERAWGISVASDQQGAGAIMKVLGGMYLWAWIAVLFFKHTSKLTDDDRGKRRYKGIVGDDGELTFEQVQDEFDKTTPAHRA